jgi:hypothetical protein
MTPRIALIGFGEVGQILGRDLPTRASTTSLAYDRLFARSDSAPSRTAALASVRVAYDMAGGLRRTATWSISAVTAGQALAVAQAAAPNLKGAIFLDLNSVAPHTRVASQAAIAAEGGTLCRGAVMAPIAPKRLKTPDPAGRAARGGLRAHGRSSWAGGRGPFGRGRTRLGRQAEPQHLRQGSGGDRHREPGQRPTHFGVEAEVLASLRTPCPIRTGPAWRTI